MAALVGLGLTIQSAAARGGCCVATASRSVRRLADEGVSSERSRSGRPVVYDAAFELKLTAFYCQSHPLPGCGRWTLRWAQAHLTAYPERVGASPSKSTIARILNKNKLKPHLSRYFLHITDPDFFPKMEHLVGLYMNPPRNLFFHDECPAIQVLKRLTPDLRTEHMQQRLEEFEYIRNGTPDVLAFLNHGDGTVHAECHGDHKTQSFVKVFERHVRACAADEPLHYVMDNLSTHIGYPFCQTVAALSAIPCPPEHELDKPAKRVRWLRSPDKRIVIHFTPYHGSWLNLVEHWFGIMNQKVLNESFDSPEQLKAAFEAFLGEWNHVLAHPFRWTYQGKGLHDKAVTRFTPMLEHDAHRIDIRILTKQLRLMSNLINDYFSQITEHAYRQLVNTLSSQLGTLTESIQRENGPVRKQNAQDALTALMTLIEDTVRHAERKTA